MKKLGVILCDELTVGVTVGVGVILGDELTGGVTVGVGVGVSVTVGVIVGVIVVVGVGEGSGPQGSPLHELSVVALTSPLGGPIPKGFQGYVVVVKGEPPTSKYVVIVVPD